MHDEHQLHGRHGVQRAVIASESDIDPIFQHVGNVGAVSAVGAVDIGIMYDGSAGPGDGLDLRFPEHGAVEEHAAGGDQSLFHVVGEGAAVVPPHLVSPFHGVLEFPEMGDEPGIILLRQLQRAVHQLFHTVPQVMNMYGHRHAAFWIVVMFNAGLRLFQRLLPVLGI